MSVWSVYIVRCSDGTLYTGISTDIKARVKKHNSGAGAKYTRARRPVVLVFTEKKRSESSAKRREAQIKRLTRLEKESLLKREMRNVDKNAQMA